MIVNEINPQQKTTSKAPDAILAELWEIKREINKAADYRIDVLVNMAHEAAKNVLYKNE